jgi:molybdopterin/thiamine biosynthesis adenylyltransferase
MIAESSLDKLKRYNILDGEDYLFEAFSRNIGIFSKKEQKRLFDARIAIPGMGGVGGTHFLTMVRTGVGNFHVADFDCYEPVNINRQVGATVSAFGRSKLEVMTEQALAVNPFISVSSFPEGIHDDNLDDFLNGVDVVIDSLDFFAFDIRRALFKRARAKGIHVITAGPLGFSSALLVFSPHKGMGFDEYFNIYNGMKPEDKYLAFAMGLAPKAVQFKYMDTSKVSLKSKKGPSLNIACQLCSAVAGAEAVKIILGRGEVKTVPYFMQFDPYTYTYVQKKLYGGSRNPVHKIKSRIVKHILNRRGGLELQDEPELPMRGSDAMRLSDEEWHYLLRAGIQAPSGDNAQPWILRKAERTVTILFNPEADTSFFNVQSIASTISCGAVIENISIAASRIGLATRVKYVTNCDEDNEVAQLFFEREDGVGDSLADFIWSRNTNRKPFSKEALPHSTLIKLRAAVTKKDGIDIHFITKRDDLKRVAQMVFKADTIRTEHKGLHRHLMEMIRFSTLEANETRDGFYIKNLEAGPAGDFFLKATRKWSAMKWANRLGLGKMVALNAYNGILQSSGVALIVASGIEKEDFVKGGRALERFWLTLTQMSYQMQPMTALTLFFLRLQLEGDGNFSKAHAGMLQQIRKEYDRLFPNCDFNRQGQIMLLRFGRADDIVYPTLRKRPEKFL